MFRYLVFLPVALTLLTAQATWLRAQSPKVDGIAAKYPGDAGIEKDPNVIFVENFEQPSLDGVSARWEMTRDPETMSLTDDIPSKSSGKRSLLIAQRAELGTGGDLYRRLDSGYDKLFARMYVKFAEDCEPMHHFGTCIGGNYPPTAWPSVRAGEPPGGDRGFWVGIEPFGDRWNWDFYTYWCEMRGSPPRGQTWGNSFIHDDSLKVERGRWICIETMIRMNAPEEHDGELALWIDGRPVSHLGKGFPRGKWVFDKFYPGQGGDGVRWNPEKGDREYLTVPDGGAPFEGFRFRTRAELNVNFLWLYVYITQASAGHTNRVWFDDVVVAKDYIGPLK